MSTSSLVLARDALLLPYGLSETDLQQVLDQLMGHRIDNADLYFQLSRSESWMLEDGIVREGHHGIEQGVGVRAVSGEKTGFAYSDEIILPALSEAANAARAIARSGRQGAVQAWRQPTNQGLYLPLDPLAAFDAAQKIALLRALDAEARRIDPRIKQVIVSLAGTHEVILVAGSDGTLAADVRPLVRMNVSVIAEQGERREQGTAGGGGRVDYSYFEQEERGLGYAREAVRQALLNLDAVAAGAVARSDWPRPGRRF